MKDAKIKKIPKVKYSSFNTVFFLLNKMMTYDKGLVVYFVLYTLCSSVTPVLTTFILPIIVKGITDNVDAMNIIIQILVILFVGQTLSLISSVCYKIYWPRIIKVRISLIEELNKKIMGLRYIDVENPEVQDNIQKAYTSVSNNAIGVEGILNQLFYGISAFFTFLGYSIILSTFSIYVLLFLICSVIAGYFYANYKNKQNHDINIQMAPYDRKSSYLNQRTQLPGLGKDIRLYNMGDWIKHCYLDAVISKEKLFKGVLRNNFSVGMFNGIIDLLRDGSVYLFLIYQVIVKSLSVANLTLYFTVVSSFSSSLASIIGSITNIKSQNLYVNDFRCFMEADMNNSQLEITQKSEDISENETVSIEFSNVSFHYPNSDVNVLKNVSFKIEKGHHIAIVGENGAGKTTIVKLLCRLYEPTEGTILINSIDYRHYNLADYYKLISAVFQDVELFSFSIAENIAMQEDKDINIDKLKSTIRKVGLNSKIRPLRKGVYTAALKRFDSQGVELSGGEQQKIYLARAIYKDSPIIVLDEPTAALDPIAEKDLYEDFHNITENKTAVYISHRLASTRFCDSILYLSAGQILERGTHDDLMSLNGCYASLFDVQSKYYVSGEDFEGRERLF